MSRLVIICGAGATLNESKATRAINRPPLDQGFFTFAKRLGTTEYHNVANYLKANYSIDPSSDEFDSLEQMMAILYSDVLNPAVTGSPSHTAFRSLLKLINFRIADTTNSITPTTHSVLYRILRNELLDHRPLSDISLISFNYDLLIEKVVFALQRSPVAAHLPPISQFPACYRLGRSFKAVIPQQAPQFPVSNATLSGIEILKLHGSLNWFSTHKSRDPSPNALLSPARKLYVTALQQVNTDMTYTPRRRTQYTYPIVVPPVMNKASVLHPSLTPIWSRAQIALESASEVVVFGYSCPVTDQESANLLSRALRRSQHLKSLSIINPSTSSVQRFADLTDAKCVYYFRGGRSYINGR